MENNILNVRDLRNGIENGYCRICGNFQKLTSDHIPPKSCGNKRRVDVTLAGQKLIFQNGFNCKTICEDCNNRLLGSSCDKVFIELYKHVKKLEKTTITIPDTITIDLDIKELLRCYLGHFLAVKMRGGISVKNYLSTVIDDDKTVFYSYRKYVLKEIITLDNFIVYYWYYPYSNVVIMPYSSFTFNFLQPNQVSILGTLIKMYPLAILIVDKEPDILRLRKLNLNEDKLYLSLYKIIPKIFPEAPVEFLNNMVITEASTMVNVERKES